jgi:hypothetical protein
MQEHHKNFAIELFNLTWDLIDKQNRSQAEIDQMINAAHASRYHWEIAGEGVNIARGEWLISRVYALLRRGESCYYHANRCLQVTLENDLKDFDLAFAYEAMARAAAITHNEINTANYIKLAEDAGTKIKDPNDRDYFFSELGTIQLVADK